MTGQPLDQTPAKDTGQARGEKGTIGDMEGLRGSKGDSKGPTIVSSVQLSPDDLTDNSSPPSRLQKTKRPKHIATKTKFKMVSDTKPTTIYDSHATPVRDGKAGPSKAVSGVSNVCGESLDTQEDIIEALKIRARDGKDADAIRALVELSKALKERPDPDEKANTAHICAFIGRAQLHGDNVAEVLMAKRGGQRVAKAMLEAFGLDAVTITYAGHDYSATREPVA